LRGGVTVGAYRSCAVIKGYEYEILVVTPEGKRPLERPRFRWEDEIRMDLEVEG
jgi:hypothetical protein